jgi:hypothetical protein
MVRTMLVVATVVAAVVAEPLRDLPIVSSVPGVYLDGMWAVTGATRDFPLTGESVHVMPVNGTALMPPAVAYIVHGPWPHQRAWVVSGDGVERVNRCQNVAESP